ncbi:hypothetical protein N181_08550 [Sinorhizobium fredii USDA 205]|nr:hypothetical protein AB395_00002375 [Sinorhizobium fredii CCBAU 45436]AWM25855.1 hypothetical protein AOX55_00002605 [Sinorhizobium fredii CCBAU 25509]KSV91786.1 hypothetical protein N181_08550 [Sinorhizobium fredii USDA 205]
MHRSDLWLLLVSGLRIFTVMRVRQIPRESPRETKPLSEREQFSASGTRSEG